MRPTVKLISRQFHGNKKLNQGLFQAAVPKRWGIFAVLALTFILGIFFRISMAVVAGDLATDLHLSANQLGILSGVFFYAFAFAQIPLGPMIDRFGGRKMVSLLGILTTSGALIFALAPDYRFALAGRVLLGIGTASILMGSLKIFTNWFSPAEFPSVSGLMAGFGSLGSLSATSPLAFAVAHCGWRNSFLAAALLQAIITLLVHLVVRDTPSAFEMTPPKKSEEPVKADSSLLNSWRLILSTPDFWFVSLLAFFWYSNYMVLLALWGGPYLREAVGLNRTDAGNILLFISFGFITGSVFLGQVTKLLSGSLEKTILSGLTLLMVSMSLLLGPAERLPMPLLATLFFTIGLSSATGVIIYPLARNMVPHSLAATAMTCVNFFLLMGAAIGQQIMGSYIEAFSRTVTGYPAKAYHGAFLIQICGLAGAILLFLLARKRFAGR